MAQKRAKSSRKKTTKKKRTTTKKSSSLTSAQKSLKVRQEEPWKRIKNAGYAHPVVYQFPWEERSLSTVASATYFPGIGYVSDNQHPALSDYAAQDYSWEKFIERKITGDTTPHKDVSSPYVLRDDQKEDVATIVAAHDAHAPEFLIANATGTGKTVTTLSAIDAINPSSILIVCPSAVIPVWRTHISQMGDGGRDYVVINYESVKKLISPPDDAVVAKKTSTQNKHIALKGIPYTTFDIVVLDEAHKTKNPTAQQSRICSTFSHHAEMTLRLTATPGKNPSQLHYLYRLLSYNTGDGIVVDTDNDFSRYITWCKNHGVTGIVPAPFGNGISFEGSHESVRAMEKIIYQPAHNGVVTAIKRVPDNWETVQRHPYPIDISSQEKQDYQLLVDDVKKILLEASTQRRMDMSRGIAAMMKMRQKSGILKAPHIVEYAKYCVEDLSEQVVISTIFHNTAEVLSSLLDDASLNHVVITGKDTHDDKESKRRAFQRGDVPVVVTSITTGISLHSNETSVGGSSAYRRMIVADIHFSPIEHTQLEGRINRNGENGIIVLPVLHDTIDEKVVSTLIDGLSTQSILQSHGDEDDMNMLAKALGISLA